MSLKNQVQQDMQSAMKLRDAVKVGALRMLVAEIKKREIDKKEPLTDAEVQKAIQSMLKQRHESVDAFLKGGREDLVKKERQEIAILQTYLPQPLSHTEVEALVEAAIQESGASVPQDIGKVMKLALAKAAGRADGKLVNEIARAKLVGK